MTQTNAQTTDTEVNDLPEPPPELVLLDAGPYGKLSVLAQPNPTTGALRCHLSTTKARGTFLLDPHFDDDNVDPATTRLIVYYGDASPPSADSASERPDRPVLYGSVTLVDYSIVDATKALAGARTLHHLGGTVWRHDAATGKHRVPAPRGSALYTAAILAALAVHWLQRPDLAALRMTAARHVLRNGFALTHKRAAIDKLQEEIANRQIALAEHRDQLERMQHILQTGPQLPSTEPCGQR